MAQTSMSKEALEKIRQLDPAAIESEEQISNPVPMLLALGESVDSSALGQVVVRVSVGSIVHSI